MLKDKKKIISVLFLILLLFVQAGQLNCVFASADMSGNDTYVRSMGQYSIVIEDGMDLLTDSEEMQLTEYMAPITEYGNVIFATASTTDNVSEAKRMYRQYSGTDSGVIFLIDMGCRQIYIFSDGDIYRKLGTYYATGITDNIYQLATDERYCDCAKEAFSQIEQVLENGDILIPMKYTNNFFMAFAISIIAVYLIAIGIRSNYNTASGGDYKKRRFASRNGDIVFSNVTKVLHAKIYHDSSSSGGGSSGGGGGGGSSGGGGGHGF